MRFYESSDFFLRVIRFDFINKAPSCNLVFRLIPVFHIGTRDFYENILDEVNSCDMVLYEGVPKRKTMFFNELGKYNHIAKRLDLVSQSNGLPVDLFKASMIHSDLDRINWQREWRQLFLTEKLKYKFLLPIQLYIHSLNINRYKLAKVFMHSAEEVELAYGPIKDKEGTLSNLMFDIREKIVISKISKIIESQKEDHKKIGVLYGAGHMNVFARFLIDKMNFYPENGKFIKVFDIK